MTKGRHIYCVSCFNLKERENVSMKNINIDIEIFKKKFDEEYEFLYNNHDNVAGYSEAVAAFDEFLAINREFVREFVKFRGDFISSDREAASFMFALDSLT